MTSPFRRRAVRASRASLTLAAACVLSACSLLVEEPDVRIADVTLRGMGLTGGTAAVTLEIENPNRFAVTSDDLRYTLEFQETAADDGSWRPLADGTWAREVRVGAGETERVALDIPFRYQDLGAAVGALLREGRLRYRLHGDARLSGLLVSTRVPFDARGTLEP